MAKLFILIAFAIISSGYCKDEDEYQKLLSSSYTSAGDKEFHFKRQSSEDEYDFRYKLDDCEDYDGKAYRVDLTIYLLFGAKDILYWVEIDDEESDKNEFTKIAHVAKRGKNTIWMKNDYYVYSLDYTKATLYRIPYLTEWDLENICFDRTNSEDQTFHYSISSLNNSRKYNGTTYRDRESDDPSIQRIHIEDNQQDEIDEIDFTEDELKSNETFCRDITTPISESIWLGPETIEIVNPNLLKSLGDYNN